MVLITALTQNDGIGNDSEYAAFLGYMGLASALVFANLGAAFGTAKSGLGICSIGVLRPHLIFRSIIPVIMAGMLGIYGLIVGIMISGGITDIGYTYKKGYAHFGAGLCCGLSSLVAGLAIGIVGDAGLRASALQPRLYIGMLLILIFAEALGLYGFIISLIIVTA